MAARCWPTALVLLAVQIGGEERTGRSRVIEEDGVLLRKGDG